MRVHSNVRAEANVEIMIHDVERGTTTTQLVRNLVVNDGLDIIRDLIGGNGFRPTHMGVGTSIATELPADVALGTEVFRGLITRRDDLPQAIQFQFFLATSDANGFSLAEVGLMVAGLQQSNPGDPAVLFSRATYTPFSKTVAVEVTYNWTITLTAL